MAKLNDIDSTNVEAKATALAADIMFNNANADVGREAFEKQLPEHLTPEIVRDVLENQIEYQLAAKKAIGVQSIDLFVNEPETNETNAKVYLGHERISLEVKTQRSKEVSGGMNADRTPKDRKTILGYNRSSVVVNAGKYYGEISADISALAAERLG